MDFRATLRNAKEFLFPPIPEPPRDNSPLMRVLSEEALRAREYDSKLRRDYMERAAELIEAKQMGGSGPWLTHENRQQLAEHPELAIRESNPLISQGAYGDIELALQNVEWRREINLSWLEFSRWGIQQIILISRLYYIKNPIVRRLVDICAAYVFARGVEVSSDNDAANDVLKEFFERNKKTFGQIALVEAERRKSTDGNLFWAFFADTTDKGLVSIRTIDATEIQDIISDPEDTDSPWYYRRTWTSRNFDPATGQVTTQSQEAYYPALYYSPATKPQTINAHPVHWDTPILHRKCGHVSKWSFGCPRVYPMLDWAKEARKFLEACATVKQALAQFSMTLTTKGGQQAMMGAKQQLETTVGPANSLWDSNPPPVNASIFASGPGTQLEPVMTRQAGADPEEVRQYKLMCCMCEGVPETFLADVSTGNLATATTLDRPTEIVFLEKQEAWVEDLVIIAKYVLSVSSGAPSGKLRESLGPAKVTIVEMRRVMQPNGRYIYEAAKKKKPNTIEVKATFPAIREGDIPELAKALSIGMTLGNTSGQVVGIDEKAGVLKMCEYFGIEDAQELVEAMYPDKEYDPDRTAEPEPPPVPPLPPNPGEAQAPGGDPTVPKPAAAPAAKESLLPLLGDLKQISEQMLEKKRKRKLKT